MIANATRLAAGWNAFGRDHPHLKVIVIEDALSSNAPHLCDLRKAKAHFILGVKPGDHAFCSVTFVKPMRRIEQRTKAKSILIQALCITSDGTRAYRSMSPTPTSWSTSSNIGRFIPMVRYSISLGSRI
jgi:hypothetical protein